MSRSRDWFQATGSHIIDRPGADARAGLIVSTIRGLDR